MQNKTTLSKHDPWHSHRFGHHIRVGAVAIAAATIFHVSGIGHFGETRGHAHAHDKDLAQMLSSRLEREKETARHGVRMELGLRIPAISGQ